MNLENRFDSEFYQKIFVKTHTYLKSKKGFEIGAKFKVTDGEHGSVVFRENGIKYLGAENIKNGYVDISKIKYVDEAVNKKNLRAEVKVGDLLISIKGTLGEIAIAEKWLLPANMSRDVAVLKPLINIDISSYLLSVFLMTKYGNIQSQRGGSGGVVQMITLGRLRKFIVPAFSQLLDKKIQELYLSFLSKRVQSKETYTQAENLLLDEIGLQNFEPSKEPVNIKSFKDSFGTSGRLDAEYYQPKYDDYLKLIEDYLNGSDTITSICNLNGKNFKPTDKIKYNYIELSNVGKTGTVDGCTTNVGKKLPSRARRKVNINDVIISSIEGSLNSCALISKEYDNALCSTGFYVINSKIINSETLLVLFKSELMQNILKQNCSGTILTGMNKDDFLNIRIPIIIKNKQQQIADLVEQSFSLKKQSEHLLEVAKRAVEIAIEENEEIAIEWIIKNEKLIIN